MQSSRTPKRKDPDGAHIYESDAMVNASSASVDLAALPVVWRDAPRRWGHPLHSLCSYFAMFPPQMATVFIRWMTSPGDTVFDPFAGRGTVPLEAILQGRRGLGADANPLAHALTRAKVKVPSAASVAGRLRQLNTSYKRTEVDTGQVPDDIRMLYSASTLRQLVFLRDKLRSTGYIDPFITGLVLGMLHANHSGSGATRGFSISMPNTFAMAPGYVREYIARKGLVAPDVDVFEMLRARAERYGLPERAITTGQSWLHDATRPAPRAVRVARPKLIFTSPPYLEVIKYGKYNWVRLWFLKADAKAVDAGLMSSSSLSRYVDFITKVLRQMKTTVADDGFVCLVIGDVRRGDEELNLAGKVWRLAAEPEGWYCHGIIADGVPTGHKVSRIWKDNEGRATKTDRVLVLSPSSDVALPKLEAIDWGRSPTLMSTETET
ncbi:MAG: hypothetical protein QOJ12_3068 [Thermoleophilales bacterium]|nr:hypothetical protein [Thermoleophilales bacterium]